MKYCFAVYMIMEIRHDSISWANYAALLLAIPIVTASLSILYLNNRDATFYVKYSSYLVSFSIIAIFAFPFMLLRPGSPRNVRIPRFFSRWLQAPMLGIRTRIKRQGGYPDGPFIIVCNHQSALDSLAMMEIYPDNCVTIMKQSLLYCGPFGAAAYLSGTIFVDRETNGKRIRVLHKAVDAINKKKCRVWFFPEGTRKLEMKERDPRREEDLLPFKKGAFNIAVLAQIPVVISPQDNFFNYREKIFTPGEMTASILPPVSTQDLTLEDVPALTNHVRALMIQEFNKLLSSTF